MAKKRKRKRHRQPVAPPVHSAPGATHAPSAPRPPMPVRPAGAEPPQAFAGDPVHDVDVAPRRAERPRRPQASRRRRKSRRPMYVIVGIALAIVAAIVVQQVLSRQQASAFDRIASAAGCGRLEVTSDSGAGEHLTQSERTTYDGSPPTHGPHAGYGRVTAGIYDKPFSDEPSAPDNIYLAVHSLEHGYVIVWHNGLSDDERSALEREYRGDKKVIVVPNPELERGTKLALTAWARRLECSKASTSVVDAFVERFREARSAPERLQS